MTKQHLLASFGEYGSKIILCASGVDLELEFNNIGYHVDDLFDLGDNTDTFFGLKVWEGNISFLEYQEVNGSGSFWTTHGHWRDLTEAEWDSLKIGKRPWLSAAEQELTSDA